MDLLDREACHRALETRDPRFDGRLFVGVTSTGIYGRPICPARRFKETFHDLFRPFGTVEQAIARLRTIRGVGEWTAQYIGLRALRETDAFPASDVGLLRGAATAAGRRPSPADLLRRSQPWRPWRPWRAYAAQHLWAADAGMVHGAVSDR